MSLGRRVAIIGAGPAGLASARAALEEGLEPHVFEAASQVGGLWRPGQMWDSMRTNLTRWTCMFGDHPWPPSDDDPAMLFPGRAEVCSYLTSYARHHDVLRHVRLGHTVESVEATTEGWTLRWRETGHSAGDRHDMESFSHLIIASGVYSEPKPRPEALAGFTGRVIHSSEYTSPEANGLVGARVLVIGGSFSGAEIAADLSHAAASVTSSARRKFWYLPRVTAGGRALDDSMYVRNSSTSAATGACADTIAVDEKPKHSTSISSSPSPPASWAQRHERLAALAVTAAGLPLPDRTRDPPAIVISEEFVEAVRHKRVQCVGPTVAASGSVVRFANTETSIKDTAHLTDDRTLTSPMAETDTTELPFDAVVLATGYRTSLSFLSTDIKRAISFDPADQLQPLLLYRHVLVPSIDTLAFVGLYRGPFFAVMELQARWACGLFSGRLERPFDDEIKRGVDEAQSVRTREPRPHFPDNESYAEGADALAALVGCLPQSHLDYVETTSTCDAGISPASNNDETRNINGSDDGATFLMEQLRHSPVISAHYRLEGSGAQPDVAASIIASASGFSKLSQTHLLHSSTSTHPSEPLVFEPVPTASYTPAFPTLSKVAARSASVLSKIVLFISGVFGTIDVECPAFDVIVKTDAYEIRRYAPRVAVQVTMRGEAENNKAFGSLARYIGVFGNPENQSIVGEAVTPAKISMTAPVVTATKAQTVAMTAPVVTDEETMRFILPDSYTIETAPTPTSDDVELVELTERTYVVLQYSGLATMTDAAKRVAKFAASLDENASVKVDADDWELYRYNAPFTLPFLRTNEIAIRMVREGDDA
jgi:dimethylaniline monooxygenase (N-oxide forming)